MVTLAYFILAASASPQVQQLTYGIAKTGQFLFPVMWVMLIQRHRPKVWPWSAKGLLFGIIFGLFVAGIMLLAYRFVLRSAPFFLSAANEIREKIDGIDIGSPTIFAAVGVFYSLIHSLLEEYYWRWFVFGQLSERTSLIKAIVFSSLGFMAHHVLVIGTYFGFLSPITWLFSFGVAIGGGVWAWLYHRTGSLLGPWTSHLLVDAAIFAIGYQIAFQIPTN
ncbi:CPBP family intramembrane glutamic endopeptidase [Bythopirellula polymerisocia]|uniref:CPBP family intramembrane glutamic endopeptidase n=1 Tax=Bythopirellula polymerisocia TaxID=2528003 RepID=UPI0011B789FA|nr:CPBP family intramembrane glutamic endopeptidase [Bythopirellula polymerisocia]